MTAAVDPSCCQRESAQPVRLTAFPLRLPGPIAAASPARPATGNPWSLELTFHELRRREATLLATDQGVRLLTPRRAPAALSRAIEQHGAALLLALQLGVLDYTTPAPWSGYAWDDLTRLRAAWFGLRFSPRVPFEIAAGVRVADHSTLRAAVAADLAAGPGAATAPALRRTLAHLFSRFGPSPSRLRVVPPARALAA